MNWYEFCCISNTFICSPNILMFRHVLLKPHAASKGLKRFRLIAGSLLVFRTHLGNISVYTINVVWVIGSQTVLDRSVLAVRINETNPHHHETCGLRKLTSRDGKGHYHILQEHNRSSLPFKAERHSVAFGTPLMKAWLTTERFPRSTVIKYRWAPFSSAQQLWCMTKLWLKLKEVTLKVTPFKLNAMKPSTDAELKWMLLKSGIETVFL